MRKQNTNSSQSKEDPGLAEGRLPWLEPLYPKLHELVEFAEQCAEKRVLMRSSFCPRARMRRKTYNLLESSRLRFAINKKDSGAQDFAHSLTMYRHIEGVTNSEPLYPSAPTKDDEEGESDSEGEAIPESETAKHKLSLLDDSPEQQELHEAISDLRACIRSAKNFRLRSRQHKERKRKRALALAQEIEQAGDSQADIYAELDTTSEESTDLDLVHETLEGKVSTMMDNCVSNHLTAISKKRLERRFPSWALPTSKHLDGFKWLDQVIGSCVKNIDELMHVLEDIPHVNGATGLRAFQLTVDRVAKFRLWLRIKESCKHLCDLTLGYHRVVSILKVGLPDVLDVQPEAITTGDEVWNDIIHKISLAQSAYLETLNLEDFDATTAIRPRESQTPPVYNTPVHTRNVRSVSINLDGADEEGGSLLAQQTPPSSAVSRHTLPMTIQPAGSPTKKRKSASAASAEMITITSGEQLARLVAAGKLHQVSMEDRKQNTIRYAYQLATSAGLEWQSLDPLKKKPWKDAARNALEIPVAISPTEHTPPVARNLKPVNSASRKRKRPGNSH
jgi:hypothetical protein